MNPNQGSCRGVVFRGGRPANSTPPPPLLRARLDSRAGSSVLVTHKRPRPQVMVSRGNSRTGKLKVLILLYQISLKPARKRVIKQLNKEGMLCQGLARLAKHQGRISIAGDALELAKTAAVCRPQRNQHKRKKPVRSRRKSGGKRRTKLEKQPVISENYGYLWRFRAQVNSGPLPARSGGTIS